MSLIYHCTTWGVWWLGQCLGVCPWPRHLIHRDVRFDDRLDLRKGIHIRHLSYKSSGRLIIWYVVIKLKRELTSRSNVVSAVNSREWTFRVSFPDYRRCRYGREKRGLSPSARRIAAMAKHSLKDSETSSRMSAAIRKGYFTYGKFTDCKSTNFHIIWTKPRVEVILWGKSGFHL